MTIGYGMGPGTAGLMAAAPGRINSGFFYNVGLVVVIIVVIIAMVGFYRVWSEVQEDEEPDSPEELLQSFREAHSAGQIDDRELERVNALLAPGGVGEGTPRAHRPVAGLEATGRAVDPGPPPLEVEDRPPSN